jgi:glucokinase
MGFMIIDAGRAQKSMRGDFEWFGSEKFFISRGLDPLKAEMEARRGNKKLRLVWQEFGEYLGIGAASIINVLEPEVLVIGGGIAHAWPLFAPHMRNTAQRFIISPPAIQKTKIVKAKLGRDAGAIGAALLIHSRI